MCALRAADLLLKPLRRQRLTMCLTITLGKPIATQRMYWILGTLCIIHTRRGLANLA